MNKAFADFLWEDYPSTNTALDQENLNKMNRGINEIDNRVIVHEATKLDKVEAQSLVKDVILDEDTGILKIVRYNGAEKTYSSLLGKISVNFDFNRETQKIILYKADGESEEIDLSAFITEYEFVDSDTIAFSTDEDGKVTAIVKNGSIEEKHLRPDYLADIIVESAKAEASANNAAEIATEAKSWAIGGTNTRENEDTDNAKYYSEQAKASAESAAEIVGGNFIPLSEKGEAGGVATLDDDGKVPKEQLPSDMHSDEKITIDDKLSEESENPVQNKIIAEKIVELNQAIEDVKTLRADLETYGMIKLSESSAVTENVGLALPATEKNPSIEGTLANSIEIIDNNLKTFNNGANNQVTIYLSTSGNDQSGVANSKSNSFATLSGSKHIWKYYDEVVFVMLDNDVVLDNETFINKRVSFSGEASKKTVTISRLIFIKCDILIDNLNVTIDETCNIIGSCSIGIGGYYNVSIVLNKNGFSISNITRKSNICSLFIYVNRTTIIPNDHYFINVDSNYPPPSIFITGSIPDKTATYWVNGKTMQQIGSSRTYIF